RSPPRRCSCPDRTRRTSRAPCCTPTAVSSTPTQGVERMTDRSAHRTAIVSGGASGIGAGAARRLARDGAALVITDVPAAAERGEAIADEIRSAGGHADFHPL